VKKNVVSKKEPQDYFRVYEQSEVRT